MRRSTPSSIDCNKSHSEKSETSRPIVSNGETVSGVPYKKPIASLSGNDKEPPGPILATPNSNVTLSSVNSEIEALPRREPDSGHLASTQRGESNSRHSKSFEYELTYSQIMYLASPERDALVTREFGRDVRLLTFRELRTARRSRPTFELTGRRVFIQPSPHQV
jgi:hypothetical protein